MNLKDHLKETFPTLTDEQRLKIHQLANHAFAVGYSYRLSEMLKPSEENHATAWDKYKEEQYKRYPNTNID